MNPVCAARPARAYFILVSRVARPVGAFDILISRAARLHVRISF